MLARRCILTVCIVYALFMDFSKIGILNCLWSSVSVLVKTHNRFLRSMDLEHSGQLSTEDCMQPIQCIFAILASGETHFPCLFISLLYPHLRLTYLPSSHCVCVGYPHNMPSSKRGKHRAFHSKKKKKRNMDKKWFSEFAFYSVFKKPGPTPAQRP